MVYLIATPLNYVARSTGGNLKLFVRNKSKYDDIAANANPTFAEESFFDRFFGYRYA